MEINFDETIARRFTMEGGGWIELKIPTVDDWKKIRQQTVSKRVEFRKVEGTPGRFEFEETNEDLQNELFWDSAIVGFGGFTNKGEVIPCTRENKILLMRKSPIFAQLFIDSSKALTEDQERQAKAALKNSLTSHDG